MNKSNVLAACAAAAFAALCAWFLWSTSSKVPAAAVPPVVNVAYATGALETFAQCLSDKGAKMYGASWCSHCQKQKAEFGSAVHAVPYVECGAGPRPQDGQTAVCAAAGVSVYPTWTFRDGTRAEGELPFAILAYKTSCEEPRPLTVPLNLTGSAAQR